MAGFRWSPQAGANVIEMGGGLALDGPNRKVSVDQRWNVVNVAAPSSIAFDMTFPNHKLILGANISLITPINMVGRAGQRGVIMIAQDATGGRTLGGKTSPWLIEGGLPVLSTAGFSVDVLHYTLSDDLSFILCSWHKGLA